jgi:hypothetical protein
MNEQFTYGYDAAGNLNYRTNNALVQNFAVVTDHFKTSQQRSNQNQPV